jgi:hypothetical protein
MQILYLCYSGFFCCDKICWENDSKEEGFILAHGFRGLSPSWWGECCRERERERESETESNRERDTERKSSLLTGRILLSSIFVLFKFQPIGWCYSYSGQLSLQPSANVFWKCSHRHTQKWILLITSLSAFQVNQMENQV